MRKLTNLLVFCLVILFIPSYAQDLNKKIPTDPDVKIGKLDNGLTYYIRRNEKPKDRVELRLVVNAGSMQENDDQQGLAHFMEHMLFNGTKNFPKNDLVKYLQSIGVGFGSALNAYTSFDETVYILPVPTDNPELVDKGFQILEDWAHNATLDNEEIDKERGVIEEEWRTGKGADQRMRDKFLPLIFKNSRYADRLPIGKIDIVRNFEYETLKSFYRDWYRPDLMAVVVVGDIDVDVAEKKIKKHFNRLKMPNNPPKKKLYPVPDHEQTFITTATDKEATGAQVIVMYKKDPKKMKTLGDLREYMVQQLYNEMINQRLEELTQKSDPPFINAFSFYGAGFARTKAAYQSYASANSEKIALGLETVLLENKRVLQHGFTKGEVERAKKSLLSDFEKSYSGRNKTFSVRFVNEYVQNFLEEEPIPSIKFQYEFAQKILPGIELKEVNSLAKQWITKENRIVIITAPDKPEVKIPTKKEIEAILVKTEKATVEPYEEEEIAKALMAEKPNKGSIVNEKTISEIGVTELMLSNGAKVVLKPTKFKDDEIIMRASSPGGHSLASNEDFYSASNASDVVVEMGVADFSSTTVRKILTGKKVRVNPYIGELQEGMSGSATPKDVEDMFQLAHLYFTKPRKDEELFESYKKRNQAQFKNMMANPQFAFYDEVTKIMSNGHPRGQALPKPENYDKIDLDRAVEIYKERFADASDFTFTFVGSFKVEEIKPLIETYIASLPSTNRSEKDKEEWKDLGVRPPSGSITKKIEKGADDKSMVMISYIKEGKYKKSTAGLVDALAEVITIKIIERLREDIGGIYSGGAYGGGQEYPYGEYNVTINYPTSVDKLDTLLEVTYAEIEKLKTEGITEEDLQKVKETAKREMETNMESNNFWAGRLNSAYYRGTDPRKITEWEKGLDAITSKKLQKAAKQFLKKENAIEIVMVPDPVEMQKLKEQQEKEQKEAGAEVDESVIKSLTPEKVINKHLEAIGGKAKLAGIKTSLLKAEMEVMGSKMTMEITRKNPNKMLMLQKMPMGGGETKVISDGTKAVVVSPQGKQEVPVEEVTKDNMMFEINYKEQGYTAKLGETSVIDSKQCIEVIFSKEGSQDIKKYYDLKEGFAIKQVSEQEMIFKNYKEVNGIKFPHTNTMKSPMGEIDLIYTEVKFNTEIPDSVFEIED